MLIRTLSALECTKVLTANRLAALACSRDAQPYVVPIYYAYAENHLYAFSMPGKKIEWMRSNPKVSLQVNERGEERDWRSVIVDGLYEELPDRTGYKEERGHAWAMLSRHFDWWEPGALKPVTPALSHHSPHVFFRIVVKELSGREATESAVT
ncbi:pyridoxamine 5'-phosphate oxidase family protein [Mesorhizobium huakuii]|uniref:pyridoxamine 5'-phosphate oxidase family protein n=1 Tax=Mesorhizobium huakuii TaxID=28104 RepID=UPI0024E175DA|nr:pyridoxamine 5'-phosphate oxidase family protein [Mesorhizobium huakuii]